MDPSATAAIGSLPTRIRKRALGEIVCLRGGPTPSPRRNGQSGGRRTDADSGQRCSHHKFESRAWVSQIVAGASHFIVDDVPGVVVAQALDFFTP